MLYSILYIPAITSCPVNRVSAPFAPPSQTTTSRLTASKYTSNLARSWPPSATPHSLDHGLYVYLHTRSITASSWISELALLQPPYPHDHGLQVHLQTRLIKTSKCMSKLARLRPPCASPNRLIYALGVYLQTRSITASICICKLARSRPPRASSTSLDHRIQVHL